MNRFARTGIFTTLLLGGLLARPAQAQVVTETYDSAALNGLGVATTSQYRAVNGFTANGFTYGVGVNPLHPTFQDDPSVNFINTLNNQVTNPAGKNLTFGAVYDFSTVSGGGPDYSLSNGSLNVRRYTAEAGGGTFGCDFWVDYKPSAIARNGITDPNGAGMHWIQVITDNWNISDPVAANQGPGRPENIVDVDITPPQGDPYYDSGPTPGTANTSFFFDGPRRLQAGVTGAPYFWNAELFVVKEVLAPTFDGAGDVTAKGKIQIYDGVKYGFVAATPEPGVIAYLLLFSGGGAALLRARRRKANPSQQ
ncbi:MAG: hypothetical protein JWL77_4618 [Chthonomonadaceae bacterium]|nr:hypothetical protein [Chthonomonadaceae bacterium]